MWQPNRGFTPNAGQILRNTQPAVRVRVVLTVLSIALALGISGVATADQPKQASTCDGPSLLQGIGTAPNHPFIAGPLGGAGADKLVKGAPYSAIGTTQTVQTTSDGNRITHTNSMRYFRDSSGRTRIEYSLSALGPFTLEQGKSLVIIRNPASGQEFVLHPDIKRADVLHINVKPTATAALQAFSLHGPEGGPSASVALTGKGSGVAPCGDLPSGPLGAPAGPERSTISLGERTIEGLRATGTRVEWSIPAGEIGNELPITVTSEQWVSQDLGIVLSRTQHDPLIGDTTYHVEQIRRAEPDPALFDVPSGYTVQPLEVPVYTQAPTTSPAPSR